MSVFLIACSPDSRELSCLCPATSFGHSRVSLANVETITTLNIPVPLIISTHAFRLGGGEAVEGVRGRRGVVAATEGAVGIFE